MNRISAFPEWLSDLTFQQQLVLMSAIRGQDGDRKSTGFKQIASAMRASIAKAAHTGRMLEIGEGVATFMDLTRFAHMDSWTRLICVTLSEEGDGANLHYYTHVMHAAQILAYKHPNPAFKERWLICYQLMVDKLHLNEETEEQMDRRLRDFGREWDV